MKSVFQNCLFINTQTYLYTYSITVLIRLNFKKLKVHIFKKYSLYYKIWRTLKTESQIFYPYTIHQTTKGKINYHYRWDF